MAVVLKIVAYVSDLGPCMKKNWVKLEKNGCIMFKPLI